MSLVKMLARRVTVIKLARIRVAKISRHSASRCATCDGCASASWKTEPVARPSAFALRRSTP